MQGIDRWVEKDGNIVRCDSDGVEWVVARVYDPKVPMQESLERRKVLKFILKACQLHGSFVSIVQSLLKAMPSGAVVQQAEVAVQKANEEQ
jgi:hypothetical protein